MKGKVDEIKIYQKLRLLDRQTKASYEEERARQKKVDLPWKYQTLQLLIDIIWTNIPSPQWYPTFVKNASPDKTEPSHLENVCPSGDT